MGHLTFDVHAARNAPRQPRDAALRFSPDVHDDHLRVVLFAQRDELLCREDGHVERAAVVLCLPDDGAVARRHAVVFVAHRGVVVVLKHDAATCCTRSADTEGLPAVCSLNVTRIDGTQGYMEATMPGILFATMRKPAKHVWA